MNGIFNSQLKIPVLALHIKYYYCMLVALDFEMTN